MTNNFLRLLQCGNESISAVESSDLVSTAL